MATVFFALLLTLLTMAAGVRLLQLKYAPSPMARQLRALHIGLSLRLFRDRILYLRSRELRMLHGYRKCIRELQLAVVMRKGFETHAAKHGPELERLLRQTDEYALIERYYDRKLKQAVTFWANMPHAQMWSIATSIRDELLRGLVPVSTVVSFLEDEQRAIKESPHLVLGHYGRMMTRMRELKKAILLAGLEGLAKRR